MSKAVIVIPARYGSSRLPGKPLLDIVGKPMIQHVYERALQVAGVTGGGRCGSLGGNRRSAC